MFSISSNNIISLIRFILLLTVFLAPLLGAYKGLGYEQAKVLFFIVLTSLSGLFWVFSKSSFKWTGITKAGGLFILILLITSISGIDPLNSILGIQPYFQGWILYAYLFLLFLIVANVRIKLDYWAYALVGSATIVGLLAIKDWILLNLLGMQIPTYAGRVVSSFGQPNFYSGFILLTLPFFLYLLASKGDALRSWWTILGFLISVVAIILSQSRTAYLILSGLIMLWLMRELVGKRLVMLGVILTTIIVTIFLSIYLSSGFLWKEIVEPYLTVNPDLTKASVENRLYIWPVTWKLILQKPLKGYGLENISHTFASYFTINKHTLFEENLKADPVLLSLKELNIDRSHNYILDLLLFSGIIGFLSWLILVIMLFVKLGQRVDDRSKFVLMTSLITYLIWIQFQNQSIVHLLYFWLLIGIIDQNLNDVS